uniref:F-box domain-containing protein n=1 Tax=Aegilops tauschii subsp. strangulata TaxID=200361 RepID=A0A453HG86_AEGTS
LSSSNRSTSDVGSSYQKSLKKGLISFTSIDLSRFTQVDEISCFPFLTWRSYRPKTKLLCRKCGSSIGYGYASGCPLIEEWSLAVCHGVRLPGWSAIGLNCNKLRILHVNRCRNICDQGLQALKDGCVRLEVLHIHGCSKITNNGLALFSIARPSVKQMVDEAMSIGPSIEDLFRLQ